MNTDSSSIQQHLPPYLSSEDQRGLLDGLQAFESGNNPDFYMSDFNDTHGDDRLQGDGWHGFELFNFGSGEKRTVQGIVLSNSCDVSAANRRETPTRITFAPLVKLSAFTNLLTKGGIEKARIDAKVLAIKSQKTSNMLFLKAGGLLKADYVVRLDDLHSMPISAHLKNEQQNKLFRLNNTGFYLFVFKLSIHFCRLQENVQRGFGAEST